MMKTLLGRFGLAFLAWGLVLNSRAASFKVADEKIPKPAQAAFQKQIESYFKKDSVKGIPLLDGSVNWNDLKQWPKEFTFQGAAYKLQLMNWKGEGQYEKLASADDIKDTMKIVASYEIDGNPPADFLILTATWSEDGALHDKGLLYASKQVFFHQFYPKGELFMASRENVKSGDTVIEYYDRTGKLRGTQKGAVLRWDEKTVAEADFKKKKDALLAN